MAIALIAVCPAECHSFVQVCDQSDMRSAYSIIFILGCLLVMACACIYTMCRATKVSSVNSETPTVQPGSRSVFGAASTVVRCNAKGTGKSVVHSPHIPTWCKDIYVCSSIQLDRNPRNSDIVRTRNKYHVQKDCSALKNSQVLQISLCKLCENKHQ